MYEGPLEAFRQQALTATLQAAAASAPTAQHSSGTASIAPDSTTRTTEVQSVRSAQGVGQQAVGSSGVQSVASSAACSGRVSCSCQTAGNTPPPQSVLGHPSPSTQQKCAGWDCATYVQDSGGCDSGGCSLRRQLYTTQLLHKAIADPARMAGYLNMPKHERLNYWSEVGGGCNGSMHNHALHWPLLALGRSMLSLLLSRRHLLNTPWRSLFDAFVDGRGRIDLVGLHMYCHY